MFIGTGNNVRLRGDLVRRVLHIRLSSADEKPELRTGFTHPNLLEWVQRTRAKLLSCVLTILRAYQCAGRPRQTLTGWGSFEGWSGVVRGAIIWLGLTDPAETRDGLEVAAGGHEASVSVMLANWPQRASGTYVELTSRKVIQRLNRTDSEEEPWRDAVEELCSGGRGGATAQSVGRVFGKYRDRNFGGRRLVARKDRTRSNKWIVEDFDPPETLTGSVGTLDAPF